MSQDEKEDFSLTKDQQNAVDLLRKFKEDKDAKFFSLCGFAGTGKTFVTANYILPMFPDIQLTATTHKACEAINRNLGYELAVTVHSHLCLKLKRKDDKKVLVIEGKPDVAPIILIDEASMIGDELLSYIKQTGSKIIFVGDPAQHMPVSEFGESSLSKCFDLSDKYKVELTEVTRQGLDNPIIKASMIIRNSEDRFDISNIESGSTIFKTSKSDEEIAKACANAIDSFHDARVACYRNYKVVLINNLVHKAIYGDTEFPFSVGEKVMFNDAYFHKTIKDDKKFTYDFRNNQECTVINVKKCDGEVIYVAVKTEDNEIIDDVPVHLNPSKIEAMVRNLFSNYFKSGKKDKLSLQRAWELKEKYAPLRHCYALTSHKLQGSTVDIMFIDANDIWSIQQDEVFNRSLYVAVTRPRNMLIVNFQN